MAKAGGNNGGHALGLGSSIVLTGAAVVSAAVLALIHPAIAYPAAGYALVTLVFERRSAFAFAGVIGAAVASAIVAKAASLYVVVFPLIGAPLTARAPYVYGALVAYSLALVGPVCAAWMRKRPALEAAAVLTAALTAGQVVALASLSSGAGLTLQGYVSTAVHAMSAQVAGFEGAEAAILAMWPSVAVALNGFAAVFATAGAGLIAARRNVTASRFPAVASIDFDPWVALPGIVAIGLIAAGRFDFALADELGTVGRNMLVVMRWVFFLQGIGVFAALYERARLGRGARSFGYVALGVTETLIPLVSLTGFADVWLNLRRLPRDKPADRAVEAPPDRD
jgi:hypothetical protein